MCKRERKNETGGDYHSFVISIKQAIYSRFFSSLRGLRNWRDDDTKICASLIYNETRSIFFFSFLSLEEKMELKRIRSLLE